MWQPFTPYNGSRPKFTYQFLLSKYGRGGGLQIDHLVLYDLNSGTYQNFTILVRKVQDDHSI